MRNGVPTEAREQQTVAQWLDMHGICWFHPPNETGIRHGYGLRRKMALQGVKPGIPDVIILDKPPNYPELHGTVVEMKPVKGGVLRDSQIEWLLKFGERGWLSVTCKGADEAIRFLEKAGYGRKR